VVDLVERLDEVRNRLLDEPAGEDLRLSVDRELRDIELRVAELGDDSGAGEPSS
jgi:hypothetical protein